MAVVAKVADWLKNLEYDGPVPSSLSKICNANTAFIWEQLITNVRHRSEVGAIRKNIIISRLAKKSLRDQQDEFDYSIREIDIYAKKRKLESKVERLQSQIEEKESEIDDLLKNNKLTYATIDNMKAKIRENLEKRFLLEKKAQVLEADLNHAREVVTLARSVTPVEMDENSNSDEITQTLQKCAEKLQKLSQQTFVSSKTNSFSKCIKMETREEPKRESLGLLRPSDYFSISDDFEFSFLSPKKDNLFVSLPKEKFDDLEVQNDLKKLLHTNNRFLILKQFGKIYDELICQFQTPLTCDTPDRDSVNHDDLTRLYFIHAKEELKKDKYRLQLEKLKETVTKREGEILSQIHGNRAEITKMFQLQSEKVYHKAIKFFLQKEINSHRQLDSGNEIYVTKSKIKQTQGEITCKIERVNNLVCDISTLISDIKTNAKETAICVKTLYFHICDMSWADFLTQGVNLEEIETFRKYPLEFNRRFAFTDRNLFYRDVAHTEVAAFADLDSADFRAVTGLIDVPFSHPESVVLDTLRKKVFLNTLKGLSEETPKLECQNFCFDEGWVGSTENQLISIIHSPVIHRVLAAPSEVRENTELWTEMSFRNFISPMRLVDGQDYRFYEEKLKELSSYQPSNDLMLRFYAYYKQATLGPCTGRRPAFYDVVGRAKYDAWKSLGEMSKSTAMAKYVDELHTIVETMSYSDKVANFLEAPTNEIECVNMIMDDLELVAGDVLEKVRSQPNSPLASREASPIRMFRSRDVSPVSTPSSAPEESDHSDDEYIDTIEFPESKKVNSEQMSNGYIPKEHVSRSRTKPQTSVDISQEVSRAVQSLKADVERLTSKINTLERSNVAVSKHRSTGLSLEAIAFIIAWPFVASFILNRYVFNRK
ncbi:hypothetical protein TcasGA2_TC009203 [Tribolium castaneum]|uniref:ACB domain-containing protein n=1 Tax=Tribolium castaneum TaxID=7070 RepID=D6WSZ0_TRICA|nr:hypothetical protein TcasGA2_TC009203 [Tribolium castaneum]